MRDFSDAFKNLSYKELLNCRKQLSVCITKAEEEHRDLTIAQNISNFVKKPVSFYPPESVEYGSVFADVLMLNLESKCTGGSTSSQWLTNSGQAYIWETGKGTPVIKNPKPLDHCPYIKKALHDINQINGLTLNSCLVTCMANGKSNLRLHDDSEETMDESQPIVVLSMGIDRAIEFFGKYQKSTEPPALSITPEAGSLYAMLPGCQEYFKHRVPTNKTLAGARYSLSFRCMKAAPVDSITPGTPGKVKDMIDQFNNNGSPKNTQPSSVPSYTQAEMSDFQPLSSVQFQQDNNSGPGVKYTKKMTTVLFGTSITKNVEGSRLGLRGRKVINISESGARINKIESRGRVADISTMVDKFVRDDPAASDIEKVILSFGTNDIKFSSKGVKHLRSHVYDLLNKVKLYFPGALVFIQCTLPIKNQYWYTCSNVLNFNNILREACYCTNSFYIDCFNDFLSYDQYDYNKALYRGDPWHLNRRGLGILCSWLKSVINRDSFNHVINRF